MSNVKFVNDLMKLPEFVTKELTKSLGVDMNGYDLVRVTKKSTEERCSLYEITQSDQLFPVFFSQTTQISDTVTLSCLRRRTLFEQDGKYFISEHADCIVESSLSEGAKAYFKYDELPENVPVKNDFGPQDKNWAMIRYMLSTVEVCDTE